MSALEFIKEWFKDNCDGDWEHQYMVQITTVDNPGWSVRIDLAFTNLEDLDVAYRLFEQSEDDWYGYSIKNKVYKAAGDPDKLELLLNKFKEIAEENSCNQ